MYVFICFVSIVIFNGDCFDCENMPSLRSVYTEGFALLAGPWHQWPGTISCNIWSVLGFLHHRDSLNLNSSPRMAQVSDFDFSEETFLTERHG